MPEPAVIVYDPYTAESIINKKVHTLRYGERKNGMYGYYERHYRGQTLYEKIASGGLGQCDLAVPETIMLPTTKCTNIHEAIPRA